MSQNPFNGLDAAYMASLNNAYRAADGSSGFSHTLPDGKYQCAICAFSLKPSKKFPDELNLSLGFEVLNGDQKGVTVYKYYSIVPERLDMLKRDMVTLGVDLEDDISKLGELPTADKILDQVVDITVKQTPRRDGQKGWYQNIYLNRSLGKLSAVMGEVLETVDDDETPFD